MSPCNMTSQMGADAHFICSVISSSLKTVHNVIDPVFGLFREK